MGILRVDYHLELLQLEDRLLRVGRTTESMIMPATESLLSGDGSAGAVVVERDDEVDVATHLIEEDIHRLILLQAPVADELRLLLSMSHVARSVERLGDYSVNVARLATEVDPSRGEPELEEQLRELALQAERAVRTGLDCFGRRDIDGLRLLGEVEEDIDLLSGGLVARLIAYAADGAGPATWSIRMIQAVRHYERMGDHAVSVAEMGSYVRTGTRRAPRAQR